MSGLTDPRSWNVKPVARARRIEAVCNVDGQDDVERFGKIRIDFEMQPYGNLLTSADRRILNHQSAFPVRRIIGAAARAVARATRRPSFWSGMGGVVLFEADGPEDGRELEIDRNGYPVGYGPIEAPGPHTRMALNQVSVSVAERISAAGLHAALGDARAPGQAYVRRLMEEASQSLLSGLVLEGFVDWRTLAEAAGRYPPADHETAAWLQDMARLSLA